jgi:hypothetical protein
VDGQALADAMKILCIFPHIGFFRHADSIVRQLCLEGHKVKLLFGELNKDKPGITDRGVQAFLNDFPQSSSGWLVERQGFWRKVTYPVRQLTNYRIYLNPQHPNPAMRIRWKPHFRSLEWKLISSRMGERVLASRAADSFLKQVEQSILPDGTVSLELVNEQPDIVFDMTNLVFNALDIEYQKAACALKIPLVMAIASWDNLTTKGTFHAMPDLVCVWNQGIADEAVNLHHIPRDRVVITGAPVLDYLFACRPTLDRQTFYEQAGIDPSREYVLYLCSSVQIAGDETSFVRDFAENLRNFPATRDTIIMVRPYPMNAPIWKDFKAENVVVWPPKGELTDIPTTRQNYFHSMFYSRAVVGVNTTAMIEATVVDKPCVTILTERYQATQTGRGHFHHLLKADFLEVAHGFGESSDVIAHILAGEDVKAGNRRKFVREFVRPCGLDRSVASLFARLAGQAARHEDFRKPSERT